MHECTLNLVYYKVSLERLREGKSHLQKALFSRNRVFYQEKHPKNSPSASFHSIFNQKSPFFRNFRTLCTEHKTPSSSLCIHHRKGAGYAKIVPVYFSTLRRRRGRRAERKRGRLSACVCSCTLTCTLMLCCSRLTAQASHNPHCAMLARRLMCLLARRVHVVMVVAMLCSLMHPLLHLLAELTCSRSYRSRVRVRVCHACVRVAALTFGK